MGREYWNQLQKLGPFDLPKKEPWIICGSGPSFHLHEDFILAYPKAGMISINQSIESLSYVDVAFLGHYEDYILARGDLDKADVVFIPNPLEIGNSGMEISAVNLLDFKWLDRYHEWRIRFYEKERELKKAQEREGCLFHGCTTSMAAIFLLWKNGIKEFWSCGLDGGKGHDSSLERYLSDEFDLPYDESRSALSRMIEELGMKENNLAILGN